MHTSQLNKKRQQLDVLIENKVTFAADSSELSIYDTYQSAQKVALHSNELLFCAMLSGKKVMHVESSQYHKAFLPHESFVLAPEQGVLIDFPQASMHAPTTCLAIEISKDKINAVANALNMQQNFAHDGLFEYVPQLVHTQHNIQTQQLLERMVHLFSEQGAQRHYLIDLSLNELITRLLQQQSRELLLASCDKPRLKTKVSDALLYIEEHLSETLDINTLCKIACMSRSKFYQQFKLAFGTSPALWQQQLRLKKARTQLLQGHAISKVCFDVGFNSASHFSRLFKQTFGIAPKECRH
ncbi:MULTISPECIES: AraC family transcriptional regulator [unclassified Pseudoalteromonas]|uniref:AraC family transcriptional regulator n=1 Tax=unclassified Pseudoalteromonas TaxID=194690 RepID=UPI000CC7B1A2|nr:MULTISPECIES: AraC family transcriptional regulator [unclassified Pseudoalteromonas]MBH0033533.1 AraC family transcriptional regulator [Pseudoalteromonas sp. NZS71_1]PLT25754.1 AraC family transcriptional regulator [Pseudoalteromonas sp. MelDa3]